MQVHNFLVIKEPRTEYKKERQTTNFGRNISLQRWKRINGWHIIESFPTQLNMAMDLNLPHYQ
eukprot:12500718-Ditylum_brightwellii.AAC.1